MRRTAVIAGVGSRLGEVLVRKFATEGCQVGMLARSDRVTGALADELGDRALAVEADVTDPSEVSNGIDRVREAFSPVKVLVHNASAPGGGPIDDTTIGSLRETWAARAGGLVNCVRACLPDLRDVEGTVLVSGTNYAADPDPRRVEWASAAAATRGVTRALSEEPFDATYVVISRAVSPPESEWSGAISADIVAERYWRLVENDDPPAEIALGTE
jgi:NADP-dependent 3-hydroxy acid dehydrogenase YdfG